MSFFKRKRKPDSSQAIRIIRFAIEDSFVVPENTSDVVVETMIAKIAKTHNFIWTDSTEGSLFDYEDEEEDGEETYNAQDEYEFESAEERNSSI